MKHYIATLVLAFTLSSVPAIAGPAADNAMAPPIRTFTDNQLRGFFSNFWWVFAIHAYMFAA